MQLMTWWGDADWIVRGVFITLIALSVISWTIMLYKAWQFGAARRKERGASPHDGALSARLGAELKQNPSDDPETLAGVLIRDCRLSLESGLTPLATIGNTAPFIGLFGTVWGIMHALQGLGDAQALSMDMVAGPVAEALVATAAGLFTAIPAVVGYNLLLRNLRVLIGAIELNTARLLAASGMGG